jgi:Methyltransferase domain
VRLREQPRIALQYLLWDPEVDNFTYDIANVGELVSFLADALDSSLEQQASYVHELLTDETLRLEVNDKTRRRPFSMKRHLSYGRRLGWYAIVRTIKPQLAVETGIHDGLGSLVLLAALDRNASEGASGRLMSFDPAPDAGWLVPDRLRRLWTPVYETSNAALARELTGGEVGFMIHDSWHTYEVEYFELETAARHAAPVCALLSDNAGETSALRDLATQLEASYHIFSESPRDHWYGGAVIGLTLLRS